MKELSHGCRPHSSNNGVRAINDERASKRSRSPSSVEGMLFFHLCQSTWRHIQGLGIAGEYKEDDDIKLWCGMLDALPFLPENQVAAGIQLIRNNTLHGFDDLVSYFDSTYVSGNFRANTRPGQNVI